ncbi:hypothetical protein MKX03_037464 [Papaver bracteatum]|nr:hypothetical protein MKX03_037464 [Papaver bracteatum]
MVFYLGSGCLDVSMLNVNEEWTRYEVIGVAGDTQLGEIDFDRGIVCHCLDDIKRQKRMDEIKNTDTRMRRLINACEEFNQNLGADNKYEIELDSFYPDENSFTCTITRTAFEVLNRKLFDRCEKAVEECLHVSKVTGCYDIFNAECNYVQEVILAGAGSQLIRPLLEEIFNGKKHISEGIDPYTAVVQGAAIQAAILSGYGAVGKFDNFSLFEVTPSRLAIDDSDITLVPRNTKFPGKFSTSFTSSINRASDCSIGIREIEREGTDSRDYHRLGKFNLHIEPPSSAVVPLELGCAVDINRIFSISHIKDKNLKHKVTWGSNTERFTAEEMDDMLRTAEEIRTAGNQVKRGKQVKRLLEMFVHEFFPEHGGSSVLCKDLDPGALRKIQEVSGWLLARSKQVLRVEDYNSKFDEINEASPGSTEFFKNVGAKCSFKDGMKDYLDCLELHADYYDSLLHEKLIKYCGKSLKWVDSDQLFAAAEYEGRWEKFWEKITSYEFAKKLYLESKRRAGEML